MATSQPIQARSMGSFSVIWTGQAVSLLGSQLVQFALVWWLTRTTGSATVLTLAAMMAVLPQVLIGPFAGALVDRWKRRTVMMVADALVALAVCLLMALFALHRVQIWHIYGLIFLRACGGAFHWPAMQASTTLMVPEAHLARIGGLNQALLGLSGIFIPPLGALAIEVLPMQGVLAIDVATAIPAIGSLLFIAVPQPARTRTPDTASLPSSVWTELREGLQFVLGWRALWLLSAIGIVINLLGRAAGSLTPLLVMQHFQGGALELGWWQMAAGIGTVIGGAVLGVWGGFRRRVVTQMVALVLDGLAIVAIGLSPQQAFAFAVALVFLTGFLEAIVLGLSGAIFQALVPPAVQGRVFALLMSLTQSAAPLGLLLAGPAADAYGVRIWWVLTGVVIAVMGAGTLLNPAITRIEEHPHTAHTQSIYLTTDP